MLDTSAEVVFTSVRLGRSKVQVEGTSGGVVVEVRVHRSDLTGVRSHAASRLTGLDVTPDHRSHVALVAHKARVEVWVLVWVGRLDMDPSTREWVFLQINQYVSN